MPSRSMPIVLFGEDVFDLTLANGADLVILRQQASELAVFAPEPSVHVGAYQHEAVLLFTEEWEVEEGLFVGSAPQSGSARKVDLPTFCIAMSDVEVTLGNPAIPDPADFRVVVPDVAVFVMSVNLGL